MNENTNNIKTKKYSFIHKLADIPNHKALYKEIQEDFFNQADTFLSQSCRGSKILIGNEAEKSPKKFVVNFYRKTQKPRFLLCLKGLLRRSPTLTLKKILPQETSRRFRSIPREEVESKFQFFKDVEKQNSSNFGSTKSILKDINPDVKKKLQKVFTYQEKAFHAYNAHEILRHKILERISNKIKRPSEKLMMNQTLNFRIKQELLKDFQSKSDNYGNIVPKTWVSILRRTKDFRENYYVAEGSEHKPIFTLLSISPGQKNEHIRSPSMSISQKCFFDKTFNETERIFLKKGKNWNIKLTKGLFKRSSSLRDYNMQNVTGIRDKTDITGLNVEGKNLLKCELEDFTKNEGKQFREFIKNLDSSGESEKDIIIAKNKDNSSS